VDAVIDPNPAWPGEPRPLGAVNDGRGTNFSVFSSSAEGVDLCLFDSHGAERRVALTEVDAHCWHAYLPEVPIGTPYGYRVHGRWDPGSGLWHNDQKLLLDPYARRIDGPVEWDPSCFAYRFDAPDEPERTDNARFVPRSVVANPFFDWGHDRPPSTPMHETVIYELHVKGFTARHPGLDPHERGTYAGLAHDRVIEHLSALGVTAIELQPVHSFVHDHHLTEKGLRNYWGYNSIGFFAPHAEYAAGHDPVAEFKHMVRTLHAAGIEVILDVVYNHTAEGNHHGPTLSFRGLDNGEYYRLEEERRYYRDYTGTGNTLDMRRPHTLQLVMDSLRYWVEEMHVDGFRFDLASALARGLHEVDRLGPFFDLIQQDPVVNRVKLIAEPWDIGEGGYQVGNFPPLWSEWNGRYRDTVRDYWRGEPATIAEFAYRFTGSSDLYAGDSSPGSSVNFVTAHDGFTMSDLVSYNEKHNDANLEDGRDGEQHNRSWNCGVEGPTDDPEVLELRGRQMRNMFTTLLLSQGVPMMLAGDEFGRTQHGNNNVYCQDNELSWIDWSLPEENQELFDFVCGLARLRREHPVFRRRRWFTGRSVRGEGDIAWLRPDGSAMQDQDWEVGFAKALGVLLNGRAVPDPGPRGERIADDTFLVMFNAHHGSTRWTMPDVPDSTGFVRLVDTKSSVIAPRPLRTRRMVMAPRSVAVLQVLR
jgi:isoamylase